MSIEQLIQLSIDEPVLVQRSTSDPQQYGRLIVEVFSRDGGGVGVADVGWEVAIGRHPFHLLDGEVRQTPRGWAVGDEWIISAVGEQDPEWQEAQAFIAARRVKGTRAAGLEAFTAEFPDEKLN